MSDWINRAPFTERCRIMLPAALAAALSCRSSVAPHSHLEHGPTLTQPPPVRDAGDVETPSVAGAPAQTIDPEADLTTPAPLTWETGKRRVVVRFLRQSIETRYVDTIFVGGDVFYPPRCGERPNASTMLCSPAHVALRSEKGKDLQLIAHRSSRTRMELFFSAEFWGSPECGAYGFWLLRIDDGGVRATPPVEECWATPTIFPNLAIDWGPPATFRANGEATGGSFRLNERAFEWVRFTSKGSPP